MAPRTGMGLISEKYVGTTALQHRRKYNPVGEVQTCIGTTLLFRMRECRLTLLYLLRYLQRHDQWLDTTTKVQTQ